METLLTESPAVLIAAALVIGLLIGSFLNVVIYRLPVMLERQWRAECAELSAPSADASAATVRLARLQAEVPAVLGKPAPFNLLVPRSACPKCHTPIASYQNIPVLSYLLLGGRCAHCKTRITPRYPLVEALTGALTAMVAWRFGPTPAALCAALITWILLALTFIDLDHQLLPDNLTLPLLWAGLAASLTGWSQSASLPVTPAGAILGAAAGYLSLWVVYHGFKLLTGKEGMGYGDFKLLAALGAWLGWQMLLPIVLLSAGVGAIVGLLLIATHRQQRGHPIPFGPFLAAAGWIAMMWGPEMVTRYLGLFR